MCPLNASAPACAPAPPRFNLYPAIHLLANEGAGTDNYYTLMFACNYGEIVMVDGNNQYVKVSHSMGVVQVGPHILVGEGSRQHDRKSECLDVKHGHMLLATAIA